MASFWWGPTAGHARVSGSGAPGFVGLAGGTPYCRALEGPGSRVHLAFGGCC